jgi:hypothetical protein
MRPAQASPSELIVSLVVRRHAASLGPFTAEAASNLSSGSDSSSTLSQGSPDPRLRPFGPGHQARYPASYPGVPAGGAGITALVSCCLSAAGIGLPGHPVPALGTGPSLRSAYRAHCARTRTGFPRSALARYDRGGCLLDPRDSGALPAGCRARSAPAASQRPVPSTPHLHPTAEWRFTRHQRRFTRFTRPACPEPVVPGWDEDPRAFPCAPHPAVTGSARQGGAGREHAPGTTRPT